MGTPVYFRENLFEILGIPVKTCLKCIYIYMYVSICINIYIDIYIDIYVCTQIGVCFLLAYIHTHKHIYIYI